MTSPTFFENLDLVRKAISSDEPVEVRWEKVRPLLQDKDIQREFWREIDEPVWIPLLEDGGYFKQSGTEIASGTRRTAPWPAIKYLIRMVPKAPEVVANILKKLDISSLSVLDDVVDASRNLPPTLGATLVPIVITSLANMGSLSLVLSSAAELCCRLADAGEGKAATELADSLFFSGTTGSSSNSSRDDTWLVDALQTAMPALFRTNPSYFIERMIELINAQIKAKRSSSRVRHQELDYDHIDDHSYIWRRTIEDHEENLSHDTFGQTIVILRDCCLQVLSDQQISLRDIFQLFLSQQSSLFTRIGLYLLSERGAAEPELVRKAILTQAYFDDYRFEHEYATLVRKQFQALPQEEKATWFGWIQAGPEPFVAPDLSPEQQKQRIDWWRLSKLHLVRTHLAGEWLSTYNALFGQYGDPDAAGLLDHHSTWGSVSPISDEVLAELPLEEVITRVNSWIPDRESESRFSDKSGLANAFGTCVGKDIPSFSKQAMLLKDSQPIFIRTFLDRVVTAVRSGVSISLDPVLQLCEWVLAQSDANVNASGIDDDRSWQWTRDTIASLIYCLCEARDGEKPRFDVSYRKAFWQIIDQVTKTTSNSYIVRDEADTDFRLEDFLTSGINSPRGKAVQAALEYARWVVLNSPEPRSMETLPEIEALVEREISGDNRSPEVLAVIGSRLGLLNWIDKKWLQGKTEELFQLGEIKTSRRTAYGWSAWNAFLIWVRPHREFYQLLRPQFAYAISQAGEIANVGEDGHGPMQRIGEHLMILYGRGDLKAAEDYDLLTNFLSTGHPALRSAAMRFVGASLSDDARIEPSQPIPSDVIERFQGIWDWYWQAVGKSDVTSRIGDSEFGWWFTCGQFPEQWSIKRLNEYFAVGGSPVPEHFLVEKLASVQEENLDFAIRALDHFVTLDRDGWRIYSERKAIEKILARGVDSPTTKESAALLINRLGRLGYVELGTLLKS